MVGDRRAWARSAGPDGRRAPRRARAATASASAWARRDSRLTSGVFWTVGGLPSDQADRRAGEVGHQLVPDVVADVGASRARRCRRAFSVGAQRLDARRRRDRRSRRPRACCGRALRCRTTPGSIDVVGRADDARPPRGRSRPPWRARRPDRGGDRSGAGGRDLASPWPYHQGMPFCTNDDGRVGAEQRPDRCRPAHAGPTPSWSPAPRPAARDRPAGRWPGPGATIFLSPASKVRPRARIASRCAPRATTETSLPAAGESRREIAADGARAEYANPHAPLSDPAVGLSLRKRRKQPWQPR